MAYFRHKTAFKKAPPKANSGIHLSSADFVRTLFLKQSLAFCDMLRSVRNLFQLLRSAVELLSNEYYSIDTDIYNNTPCRTEGERHAFDTYIFDQHHTGRFYNPRPQPPKKG